ncbi:phage tail assembly chaperone [Pseudomonas koreensis]|uniref:phage tail assembly chaperone n=1 Tax=Pseudomonas koreensis TaxID=198620 RepID=UPI00301A7311
MLTSKSTRGFYDPSIHAVIPSDAVEISADYHAELLRGDSEGKSIVWGNDGYPVLTDPPPPSVEVLAETERAWRNLRLAETDGLVSRHRDELEASSSTTLITEQYTELQAYRQQLRKWPEAGEFPFAEHRPPAPTWLSKVIL